MRPSRRALRDLATFSAIALLLAAVHLLPPDTSLARIEKRGALEACVPAAYPPLVTGDRGRPGLDVALLQAVADRLGVALRLQTVEAMGRDFNPRTWGITRAHCDILAGGVVDTPGTRSFLEVTRPHARTGWVAILPAPGGPVRLDGRRVAVLAGASGLDRLALSRYLRAHKVRPAILNDPQELAAGLAGGRFAVAVTEALLAGRIAAGHGWSVRPLAGLATRHELAFGLWKGDVTLKRAVDSALETLEADGTADALREDYLGRSAAAPVPATG